MIHSFLKLKDASCMIFTGVILGLLCACAGQEVKPVDIPQSANPQEMITQLENDLALGREKQLNVLAPSWFVRAETSLENAKGLMEGKAAGEQILKEIALARAQLNKAVELGDLARGVIPEAIKNRNLARAAGATALGKDYEAAETRFLELTSDIEKENLDAARRRQPAVAAEFADLELRAIKVQTIGEVRRLIEMAEEKKYPAIAPRSYAEARQKLVEADLFITENRYQKERMQAMANEALFAARRLHGVAEQSLAVQDMDPEQVTLSTEEMLHRISRKLGTPDMRDNAFERQLENIIASIDAMQSELAFMSEKIQAQEISIQRMEKEMAALETTNRKEQAELERLMMEKRMDQKFFEVKKMFDAREAEVYRKENQLIVRLKAMQFPVGKSVVLPANYGLLTKVQQAIRTFGQPDVIIGGHTDSTGSDELNEHLSQQRADAVREYLVASGVLPYEKIVSVGYGSMRPIASNATEAGRAMNRRIDVTITPELQAPSE
jgi:outer membrane protein OmpA-like peptidoglycan-associated protein